MRTQRREDRSTPARKTCRRGPRNRSRLTSSTEGAGVLGMAHTALIARHDRANASDGTAPPGSLRFCPSDQHLSPGITRRTATISLQKDYRIVLLVLQELRRGSPPFGAGIGAEIGTPANHGSSLPHIPSPSGFATLHPTLPQVLAGRRRRAERYDGKGNLYLQHAA